MRGFMTARGLPDNPRSSRHILKDFVNGKLLYCVPPPSVDSASFQDYEAHLKKRVAKTVAKPTPHQLKVTKVRFNHSFLRSDHVLKYIVCVIDELQQRPDCGPEFLCAKCGYSSQQRPSFCSRNYEH